MHRKRAPFLLALFLISQLNNVVSGAVVTPVTVTNASPDYLGIYPGSEAVDQMQDEFLSEQGTSTFLEFDFGSAKTVDGFVNVTPADPARSIGANRLIFDTDGTAGFNAATDTVVNFTQAQTGSQGQGFINRFRAVTAQRVRWEVLAVVGSPALVGSTEMAFLSTSGATAPIRTVSVIGSATAFSPQFAAANAANGIAGIGNVSGVEYASAGLGAGAYVDFDLGSVQAVRGFDLFDRLFLIDRVSSFDLIFSNNADMSSPVATRSYSKASSWTASDTFTAPILARYVRFDVTAGSGNTGLGDIQFYASEFNGANLGAVVSGSPREVTFNVTGKTGVVNDVTVEWTFSPAQVNANEAWVELIAPDNTLCDVFRAGTVDDTDIAGPYVFNDAYTTMLSSVVISTAGGTAAAGNYRPDYGLAPRSFRTSFGGKSPNGTWKLRVQDILPGAPPSISSASLSILTVPPPPTVVSVSPNVSLPAGGNVTITGADFTGTPTVTIGGTAATNVTLVNNTTITCTVPAGTVGSKAVVVTNENGSGTLANGYRYTDLVVTSTNDAGAGTLREALSDAQTLAGANTITFAAALSGQTIRPTTFPIAGSGYTTDDTAGVTVDASTLSGGITLTTDTANARIFYVRTGALALKNLTIANSGGSIPGGGIFSSGTLTVERCTLNNNIAAGQEGGAIYTNGTATLIQSTFTGNVAGNGAAVHNNGTLTVRHCTIAGNTANTGGGIFMQQGMTLENSIVANNTANLGSDLHNVTSLTRVGANIVRVLHTNSGLIGSGTLSNSDPLLGSFGSNGGPTRTFPLLAGSPAVNAAVGSSITSDQRGQAIVATPDIGAFEAQTSLPVVTSPTSAAVNFTVATLGGNVTNNGALTLSARGVVYSITGTNNNPIIGGTGVTQVVEGGTGTGVFTVNLTGLTPGTAYSFKAYATNSLGTSYTSGGTFSTPVLPVEINVIPSTAQNYGTQRTGVASVARRFTVENLGNAALTLSSVAMMGGNEGDFVVNTTGMLNSVPALGSTTFTVAFNPIATGARSSTLRIVSNDADEGNTDIALTGTGSTIDPPVLAAAPSSSALLGTSVNLGGVVTSEGGGVLSERGVIVGPTSDLYLGAEEVTKWTASGTTTGAFNVPVSGLISGGAYTYRAFATNEGGTSYSDAVNFTTPSNNADLASLTVFAGTLSPSFASATTSYTLSVANSVTSFTVTPTRASNTASIEARVGLNGFSPATSGAATAPFALAVGSNTVQVRVTAEDGTIKIYGLTVTRAPSTNAVLSSLVISTGTLAPAFNGNTLAYSVSVANTVTNLTLTPTVVQPEASVRVNSVPVPSGQASGSIDLEVGVNPITVSVTAEDGNTVRDYLVSVTRADFPNTAPSFVIPTATGSVLGAVWTERLTDAGRSWYDVAMSPNGQNIAACVNGGGIWTSADGGVSWTERTSAGMRAWLSICSSDDGTKLAAAAGEEGLWTSADGGATWTNRAGALTAPWNEVTCDSSGMKLFANYGFNNNTAYTSTNQGAAWTPRNFPRCEELVSSANGNILAGISSQTGRLQVSTNGGGTWEPKGPIERATFMAMSADGSRFYVCINDGTIRRSINSGADFTTLSLPGHATGVVCSGDGLRLAWVDAEDGGRASVYTSTDGGTTPIKTPVQPVISTWLLSMAGNGSRLVAIPEIENWLHFTEGTVSSAQTAQAGDPQQSVVNFVTQISKGTRASESTQTVSFNVTNTNNALFSAQPAIAADGTLTYTPAASGSGSATVSIVAQDNGGTANGGVNSSAPQTFNITITPADNLDLSALALSTGTVSPVFTAATTSYSTSVSDTVASVTLTATLADTAMKLSINGSAATSGSASPALPLDYGPNTLTATVSNPSGTRSKAYTIAVTRTPVAPTVTESQFSAVVATAADLSGNVTADGGAAITERGIVYALTSENANPEIGGTGVTKVNAASNGLGVFTISVIDLSEDSNYSFRAYAKNDQDLIGYSSVGDFKTAVVTRPEIVTVFPKASLPAGGGNLALTGRYLTGTTSVTVGGVAATGINVVNDGTLTCVVPAGTVGTKDIVVTTSIGVTTVRDSFRFVDLTVTTSADSGPGTLRDTLRNAADMAGVKTITFAPALATQTIAVLPVLIAGTGNDSGYVIDDVGGLIIEGNGVTLTQQNSRTAACRIFYLRSGAMTLRGLTLQGAGGLLPGGAIFSSGTLTLERCTLDNNSATEGGAIYNDNGTLIVTQSTITRGKAEKGGAIFNNGNLHVRHSTIAGNWAGTSAGGIEMAKAMTLENSIVAGNTARLGLDIFNNAPLQRVGANIVPILHTNIGLTGSGVLLNSDPMLSGLAANGGLTRTMLIQSSSPAINAAVGSSITTDQRGVAVTGTPDIGAVDVPPSAPVLGLARFVSTSGSTASVEGLVTSNGGAVLTARGFVYALANAAPTIGGTGTTNVPISGTTIGSFSGNLTGLTPGGAYSFRAYATNGVGDPSYSPVANFSIRSDNANLATLEISSGNLTPEFDPAVTSYSATVDNQFSSVTLTLATPQNKGTFTVNGGVNTTVPLVVGANSISVIVTAENGTTTKTYTLNVSRSTGVPVLPPATFTQFSGGRLFSCRNIKSLGSPITAQGLVFALVSVNNDPRLGGNGVTNRPGTFFVDQISVTDNTMLAGSTYAYAMYATNAAGATGYSTTGVITIPNTNANLNGLVLNSGTLAPAFTAATTSYTASTGASFVQVTPTAAAAGSIVRVNGSVVGAGSSSREIPLVSGLNTLTVLVTAPDGNTTKTYTVGLTRAAKPPLLASATTKTSVLATTATLGGSIDEDNGDAITERGIVYALTSVNNNPSLGPPLGTGVIKVQSSGTTIGAFTVPVSGLTANSSYTFKAYATNSAGTGYSNVGTFSTGSGLPNTAPNFTMPISSVAPAGSTWINTAAVGVSSIDCTGDGQKVVVAANPGRLFTSTDGGASWIARAITQNSFSTNLNLNWTSVAISDSGERIYGFFDTPLFRGYPSANVATSQDGGQSFVNDPQLGRFFGRVAVSNDGLRVFGLDTSSQAALYVKSNLGFAYDYKPIGGLAVTCSADGLTVLVGNRSYDATSPTLFLSKDGGNNWSPLKGTGPQTWKALAMSANGKRILAAAERGALWFSENEGGTWTESLPGKRDWSCAASSMDGKVLAAAASDGKVWTSENFGKDWTEQSASPDTGWTQLVMSSDAMTMYGVRDNVVVKSVGGPAPYTLPVNPGAGRVTVSAFCTAITPGTNEANQIVDFFVTTNNDSLFLVAPTISRDGTLTFVPGTTPGQATVTVVAKDDGGTANGGVDSSTARTFIIKLVNDDSIGGWSTAAWTNDASSGIAPGRTVWAYNFGSNTATNVNGEIVEGVPTSTFSNANLDFTGPNNVVEIDGNTLSNSGAASGQIAKSFVRGGNPTEVKLKNLGKGIPYSLHFLTVGWDGDSLNQRLQHFSSGSDALQVDPTALGVDNGTRVTYTFTADTAERTVSVAQANNEGRSFHLYGLVLTVGSSVANTEPTGIGITNTVIPENNKRGDIVGTLSTADFDSSQLHTYALVPGTGSTDNAFFAIRGSSLALLVSADYETKSSYSIRLRSTDNGFPRKSVESQMTILVGPVDEPATDIVLSPNFIAENSAPGSLVGTLRDIGDPDVTRSAKNFSLDEGTADAGKFRIMETGGINNVATLVLAADFRPDFETQREYKVRIRSAQGTSQAAISGPGAFVKEILIRITDENDAPSLSTSATPLAANRSINEDESLVLPLFVNDSETGASSVRVTAISSNTAVVSSSGIAITGEGENRTLTVTPLPDVSGTTTITVSATDGALVNRQPFTLTVNPVNDGPVFEVPTLIYRSAADRQPILNFLKNLNPGPGPLEEGQKIVSIELKADNKVLFPDGKIYYSEFQHRWQTPKLYMYSTPGQTGRAIVTVTVKDNGGTVAGRNDDVTVKTFEVIVQSNSSPQNLTLSNLTVPENSPIGTVVGVLSATDSDFPVQRLSFSLPTGAADNNFFTLDTSTNTIRTKGVANFEARSSYVLYASVVDNGVPRANLDVAFRIQVTDENDAPTSIIATDRNGIKSGAGDSITIFENPGEGAILGTVAAVDPDADQTHILELVAGEGATDNALIELKKVEGENFYQVVARTDTDFDFEKKREYRFRMKATDSGSSALSTERIIRVLVDNINEPPTDIILRAQNGKQILPENILAREGRFYEGIVITNRDRGDGSSIWGLLSGPTGVIAELDAHDDEQGQADLNKQPAAPRSFSYKIVNEDGTDFDKFVLLTEQVSSKGVITDTKRVFLRRAPETTFDWECESARSYKVRILVTDDGLYGNNTGVEGYKYFSRSEYRPRQFAKTFTIKLDPVDEPLLFDSQFLIASQRPGAKLMDITFPLHDPDTPTVNVSKLEWSPDGGTTWNDANTIEGDIGVLPGSKRPTPRSRPVDDNRIDWRHDVRRIVWNVGRDWNNQFTDKLLIRLTVNGTAHTSRSSAVLNTQGDGPMRVEGYVINKNTKLPYIPNIALGGKPIKVTLGSNSAEVTYSGEKKGQFVLNNCAPGVLTVSHELFVPYEIQVEAPPQGQHVYLHQLPMTPDTDPPVVHQIFMTTAGGTLGRTDRGIALSDFGVKSVAQIDINWGKARKTGALAIGDQVNIYLNANPSATTEQLLQSGQLFQSATGTTSVFFKSNEIDYDANFRGTLQAGANNITVIAKNELGQWSDKPEVKPVYVLPLPKMIDVLAPAPRSPGRKVFSTDQLGFDFGTVDLYAVAKLPFLGKWGIEFGSSGSFDYTMSDGNWELAYRGGDLNLFGNQFLNTKINGRDGYESPYEEEGEDDPTPALNLKNILVPPLPPNPFEKPDGIPRIALYLGEDTREVAFFARANGGVSATEGFEIPEVQGALAQRGGGTVAEVNLAEYFGVPGPVAKYIAPTLKLDAATILNGSATYSPFYPLGSPVPIYKITKATLGGELDLKLSLAAGGKFAGAEVYVGGLVNARLGYPAPLLREFNGRVYAGYSWWVGFLDGGDEITLAQISEAAPDDPDRKRTLRSGYSTPVLALSGNVPESTPSEVNFGLPQLAVVGHTHRPVGPMKRPWREYGTEHFNLSKVASPSVRVQARSAKLRVAEVAPPRSGVSEELDLFNSLGSPKPTKGPSKRIINSDRIISSGPLPAEAELPLLQNVFPRSRQALAESNGKLMLAYVRDIGAQNPIHFTQIFYTYYNGTSWTAPGAVAADPRGQTAPQIKVDGKGNFVATWTRVKDFTFDGVGGLDAQSTLMELVSSTWNAQNGEWSDAVALTENDVLDHEAVLSGPLDDGDLMLTWTQNSASQLVATPQAPDTVMTARWDAASQSWSPVASIISGLSHVTSSDFSASGNKAVYVYTADADGNTEDASDAELYSISWNGSVWGAPVRLTNNDVADRNARVIVKPDGEVYVIWQSDESMVMDRNFSGTPGTVREDATDGGFSDFALACGTNGNLIVLWRQQLDGNFDAFYRIYDASTQSWSADSRLSNDFDSESNFSPIWDPQNNLIIAYQNTQLTRTSLKVKLDDGSEGTVDGAIQPGRTDLVLARRLLTTDLTVSNFSAKASTWGPGSVVTLSAALVNAGNLPIASPSVSFYDGDPAEGGSLITTFTVPGSLSGASIHEVTHDWVVPADPDIWHSIHVVADPSNSVREFVETNNSLSSLVGGPDLKLEYLTGGSFNDGAVQMGVRVSNAGSPTSTATTVKVWASPERGTEPLLSETVPPLAAGTNTEIALALPAGAITGGERTFEIVVNEENLEIEPNQGNNQAVATITRQMPPSNITGLSELFVTNATLSPLFATDITAYAVSVPFDATAVTVVPTAVHSGSLIEVNGAPVVSGTASEALQLNSGSTQISILVTSEDGSNKMTYTVDVHRGITNGDDSGNGSLRGLVGAAALRGGINTIALGREFDGRTIRLNSPVVINDGSNVIIDGSALENGVTIEGSGNHRLFEVAEDSSLTLICVTLKGGGGSAFVADGGAIQSDGTLRIQRCTLLGNEAANGGAVHSSDTGELFVEQSTFAENIASTTGGAIFIEGEGSISFSTLTTNEGGALQSTGVVTLENNIIADNTGGNVGASGNPNVIYRGANIIPGATVGTGPAPLSDDPLLSELGRFGGPTETFVPQAGSPAIDHAVAGSSLPAVDQRGYARTVGTQPDLGSTEGRVLIVNTTVDELDPKGVIGTGYSLREAARDAEEGATILFDRAIFHGGTATTNTLTLTRGPLNPERNIRLDGTRNPGGMRIVTNLSIATQPAPRTVDPGGSATFSVVPLAISGGVAYQWRKDGVEIGGAVTSNLSLRAVSGADAGVYDVVLDPTKSAGAITLAEVELIALPIVSQPVSLTVGEPVVSIAQSAAHAILPLGGSHTLSVVAFGANETGLRYQWYKDGKLVPRATGTNLTLMNVSLANAGAYSCAVTVGTTTVVSNSTEIVVVDATPKTVSLPVGGTFKPLVRVAGNVTSLSWQRDGIDLGIESSTFTIKPVSLANAGLYTCIVTGRGGSIDNGFNTTLNLTDRAPLLGAISLPNAFIGQNYYYKIPVLPLAGGSATGFAVSGALPKGITLNAATGVLSGRPTVTKAGGYPLTFTASNGKLRSAPRSANLAVIGIEPSAIGVFAGPAPRSPLNGNLGGRFDLTTTATGTFSGSLTLGARPAIAFRNLLMQVGGAGDQVLTGNISGITMLDKTPLAALVEVFVADQSARLTLTHPNGTQLIVPAWRNSWSPTNLATSFATNYSVRLDPRENGEVSPAGYGFASFSVGTNGVARLTGKLPDGSVITGGGFIGRQGELLIFQLLYGTGGSLVGQMAVQKAAILNDNSVGGSLTWSKPASAKDTLYRNGFAPVSVEVKGSPYVPLAPGQRLLDLAAVTAPATNAAFSFLSGGLSAELRQEVTIFNPSATGLTNTAILPAGAPNSFRVTRLDARTGGFAGSFTLAGATAPLNRPATFEGTVVRIDGFALGYGFFLLPKEPVGTETIKTAPRLSGKGTLGGR
jgi:hypothetical protein